MTSRSQILMSLMIGTSAAFTVVLAGCVLIKAHGGIWPWWFHGVAVALITGAITTLLTRLHLNEVSRREVRRLAGERMSHEVCTALQILTQCTYLQPNQRAQWEADAIERLRVAARDILPGILGIPNNARPIPISALKDVKEARLAQQERESLQTRAVSGDN